MQKLERAKRQELESEEHMRTMAVHEKQRLLSDIKKMEKDLDDMRDLCSMYEVYIVYNSLPPPRRLCFHWR